MLRVSRYVFLSGFQLSVSMFRDRGRAMIGRFYDIMTFSGAGGLFIASISVPICA